MIGTGAFKLKVAVYCISNYMTFRARNPRWEPGMGMIPPSPANRGWGWGWTPDPRQIGDGPRDPHRVPIPGQIRDGDGDGDRGFRALLYVRKNQGYEERTSNFKTALKQETYNLLR